MTKNIVMMLTNVDKMGKSGKKTGWYLPEVAHPYEIFRQHGYNITFASCDGGAAPVDESSVEKFAHDPICLKFMQDPAATAAVRETKSISSLRPQDFHGIWVAGGHGCMWDMPNDEALARFISNLYERGAAVATICHGAAALVNVQLASGKNIVEGKEVTCFSNKEEDTMKLSGVMPFLLETRLAELGAKIKTAEPGKECVCKTERLVTGQNPASSMGTALVFAKLIH